jgi:imidazole glycerol phosphate synthase subunit HisF
VRDGVVVKGVQFRDHRVVGDIMTLAARYRDEGADELVFYDITATVSGDLPLTPPCQAAPPCLHESGGAVVRVAGCAMIGPP